MNVLKFTYSAITLLPPVQDRERYGRFNTIDAILNPINSRSRTWMGYGIPKSVHGPTLVDDRSRAEFIDWRASSEVSGCR